MDRLVAATIGLGVLGLSLWLGFQIQVHASRPEYLIPSIAKGVVLLAIVAILGGTAVAVALPRGWVMFLVALAFLLVLFGILLTLLGIPLLALGGGLVVVAYRLLVGVRPAVRRAIFALGGLTAVSIAFLFMAWRHPPLVDCSTGSVSASYWYWGGGPDSTSGSSSSTPHGETRGTETFDGKTHSYVCRDGELLEFTTSTDERS